MHNMLQKIISQKKKDIMPSKVRNFYNLFPAKKGMVIIGELKFASPSDSSIGVGKSLIPQTIAYEKAGIQALSVITEKSFFKGEKHYIPDVKRFVSLPVLQKDFVIDESQIYEAKVLASDAILFIARIVDKKTLQKFVLLAKKLCIEPVVEIGNKEDLKKALSTTTGIIAVNARDLDTFVVNVEKACLLMKMIPKHFIALGFSGIESEKEIAQYKNAGASGVLIGTRLMKAKNIRNFVRRLHI